jgi:heme/copper-type cytochrome/quinol oxidase subunit 3
MKTSSDRPNAKLYSLLLAIQVVGGVTFVCQQLPEFRQIAANPGQQLPRDPLADLMTVGIFVVMQIAFWYRLRRVPIPFRYQNAVLSHLLLFLGRLSFIFGSALFSVAVFRHLPQLGRDTDPLLAISRGAILIASLFALFCASLEVERLGQAFDGNRH